MKSLMEKLYEGTLIPDETIVPNDPAYRQLIRQTAEALELWRKKHSDEEFQELEALLDLCSQTQSMELTSSFVRGFRLGAGLMVEISTGQDELARKLSTFHAEPS